MCYFYVIDFQFHIASDVTESASVFDIDLTKYLFVRGTNYSFEEMDTDYKVNFQIINTLLTPVN